MRILSKLGMPESIASHPQLVAKELNIISECVDKSFIELGLLSFGDQVFNILHRLGMSRLVSIISFFVSLYVRFQMLISVQTYDSLIAIRTTIKLCSRSAILTVAKFCLTKAIMEDKNMTIKHQIQCRDEAIDLLEDRNFVKAYGYQTVWFFFKIRI